MGKSKEAILVGTIKGLLVEEAQKRNKSSNAFNTPALALVAEVISEKFKVECRLQHVHNRLKRKHPKYEWVLNRKLEMALVFEEEISTGTSPAGTAQSRSRPRRENVRASVGNEHINSVMNALVKIADAIGKLISDDGVNATQLYEQMMSMEEFNGESLVAAFDHLMQHQKVAMK
ncbi:hypothetical protein GOBAR_AA28213 [Gossypium barbadense]|uniref:Myb/SANT-like domain-containing protein n=1 Tax=Gossypium barbadense TaxID=3634 RepID=A0A2P5WMZ3_GOSBA|nr:hypothetical protein GOBAR_AA28213 [Gossypium barbadense]